MIYIILIFIAFFVYLIYKNQKPFVVSKEKALQNLQNAIGLREEMVSDKIKTSHLKDYLDYEEDLYECGKKTLLDLTSALNTRTPSCPK